MQIRRRLMMQNGVLDTSPVILAYNTRFPNGSGSPFYKEGTCVTKQYEYPASNAKQTLVTSQVTPNIRLYTNGTYTDYWAWHDTDGYNRNVINIGSNSIEFCVNMSNVDYSYAYLQETGQILFAGKNSIYYGHRNISELS